MLFPTLYNHVIRLVLAARVPPTNLHASMKYAACPKCAHSPLPENQEFPETCPRCGVVLAKYAPVHRAIAARKDARELNRLKGAEGWPEGLSGWLLCMPAQVSRLHWQGRIVLLAVFTLWSFWILKDFDIQDGHPGSRFLHLVLTPFHEAGHYLIFRWFGQFIMTLGGTLGQHLLPIVLGVALLVQRHDAFGAAICFWLLGFSVADMGIYMYDAFDPKLMLLDGRTGAESDGHDWQNIFGDLGLLKRSRSIGTFSAWLGAFMMLAGLVWAGWVVWLQRVRLTDSPFVEDDAV